MPKVWRYLPHDEARVRRLCSELRVAPLTAQVLLARGFSCGADAGGFLNPRLVDLYDPELLPGVSEAADRIVAAVRAKRRITIYGDYDVDGVTATSLLWCCLKLAGAEVDYYIPCRLEEGYGLNSEALLKLHAEDPGRLVVTVDCGITSVAEAETARQAGLELIVTDHHQYGDVLPEAAAVVHPRLPGSDYPADGRELCGVGVAFKLAWAICQRLGDGKKASPRMREFLKSAVGLAAIGTIADVVPLLGENRVIVRYGLGALTHQPSAGLKALFQVAKLDGKRAIECDDVGFALGPRINAAGRLGQARLAVELLTTEDDERAKVLADYLEQLNTNRKSVERKILKQAKELVAETPEWAEHDALVLAHHDWHPGVIGIVANRIAEHFEKPAILISLNRQTGVGNGSGRSFGGCDLHAALAGCRSRLQAFGGHRAAAGLSIACDGIDGFRTDFCNWVRDNHQVSSRELELRIDAEVRLADVTYRSVVELDRLGPFGHMNPRPVFAATQVQLAEPPRTMGDGDRHLSLRVRQHDTTIRAVAFGRGEWADEIAAAGDSIAISFAPGINHFRGRQSVELQLMDWQADTGGSRKQPVSESATAR